MSLTWFPLELHLTGMFPWKETLRKNLLEILYKEHLEELLEGSVKSVLADTEVLLSPFSLSRT